MIRFAEIPNPFPRALTQESIREYQKKDFVCRQFKYLARIVESLGLKKDYAYRNSGHQYHQVKFYGQVVALFTSTNPYQTSPYEGNVTERIILTFGPSEGKPTPDIDVDISCFNRQTGKLIEEKLTTPENVLGSMLPFDRIMRDYLSPVNASIHVALANLPTQRQ